MTDSLIRAIQEYYGSAGFIPLHAPLFRGREKQYLIDTIDSTFVSSVGKYVERFENEIAKYAGSPRAIATVNGTAALHIALRLAGVNAGDLVITQPLTFVATCNAISYIGAAPIFVDVDRSTMGLSASATDSWLSENAFIDDSGLCKTRDDQKIIRACLPMHTFGHPADMIGLVNVCKKWNLKLVEDAAESIGSLYQGKHTGSFGVLGVLSFNGNKLITTGGGGMILTDNTLAEHAKHLTTTAKIPHAYNFFHDQIGYNYRMPNLNAALGCAQLEQLEGFITEKRRLAGFYDSFLKKSDMIFFHEPPDCRSNYWLNAVICNDEKHRDAILKTTNAAGIMTRPIWQLMNTLPMFNKCLRGPLPQAEWLASRVVNLPSSVPQIENNA